MGELSKSQVDKLGERLRKGDSTEADLRLLDEYKGSYLAAFEAVFAALRSASPSPTGRFPKTTASVIEKLRRETVRLSQMQDIAGCRVIVEGTRAQNDFCETLVSTFRGSHVFDRRERPSHGYRAIHIIAMHEDAAVEIQLRTRMQHVWAELSEKASDVVDPAIKYGGGPENWRTLLGNCSNLIMECEGLELDIQNLKAKVLRLAERSRKLSKYAQRMSSFKYFFIGYYFRRRARESAAKNEQSLNALLSTESALIEMTTKLIGALSDAATLLRKVSRRSQ